MKYKNWDKNWELTLGFYPGFVIGMRSYPHEESTQHVIYLPFVDLCLEIFVESNSKFFLIKNAFKKK